LQNHHHLAEEIVKRLFYKIVVAVSHLHQSDYFHFDINAENIYIDDDENVKMDPIGFG